MFYTDGLPVEIIDVFRIKRTKSFYKTPKRPFHLLSKRISGYCDMEIENTNIRVSSESLLYIPEETEYSRKSEVDEDIIVIHFNLMSQKRQGWELIDVDSSACNKVFEEILQIWSQKGTGFKYKCAGLLYGFLSNVLISHQAEKRPDLLDPSVSYIKSNYHQKIYISDLAKMSNVSESYYRRSFKKEYGLTPVDFINEYRVKRAKEKIFSGYYTMAQVAEICGFSDQKYFNRIFKKITGLSPLAYKRSL